ncbi:hypothetical protein MY11210_009380 [Beauveria gryllotalpidicola]
MTAYEVFALSPEQRKLAQDSRDAIRVKDGKPLYCRPDGVIELWGYAWPLVGDSLYESLKPLTLQILKNQNKNLKSYTRSTVMLVKGAVLRADNCASALVVRLEHANTNSIAILLPPPGSTEPNMTSSEIAWPAAGASIVPNGWGFKAVTDDLYLAIWSFYI